MINYRSIQDLNRTIQANLHKVPRGTEVLAGVHRSGHLAASLLGAQLNIPVISLRNLCETDWVYTGHRGYIDPEDQEVFLQTKRRVLVVEDATTSGSTLLREQGRVSSSEKAARHEITYLSVYPAKEDVQGVDLWFEVVPGPRLFEWNWLNHGMMGSGLVSMEGILCRPPTADEEQDEVKLRKYCSSAAPLHIPGRVVTNVVSTRIMTYKPTTRRWLETHGVKASKLHMLPCNNITERNNWGTAKFKAGVYMNLPDAKLFFDGDAEDAREVFEITKRPVFSVPTKELFQ